MKTCKEMRIDNLRHLSRLAGGAVKLADSLGVEKSYVSQMIGKNPTVSVSDSTARLAEELYDKEPGWLDHEWTNPDESGPDLDLLEDVIEAVESALIQFKISKISTRKKAELIIAIYNISPGKECPPQKTIMQMINLAT